MKAVIKPRIDVYDRETLRAMIPLRTPHVIYIDPCDMCNFQCKFCPTGDHALMKSTAGRWHGIMDYTMYTNIIDSLSDYEEKVKVIRLYKDGEPLLNPKLPEMIRYAKESGHCEKVDTTTNGSLLTPELSLRLIEAGIDRINISVEGMNAEQYKDFSRYKLDFQKFVDNIKFLYTNKQQCEINIKISGAVLDEEQKQQFYDTFGDYADGVCIEYPIDYWPTFAQEEIPIDDSIGLMGYEASEVKVCPYIFYEQVINSDGTYSMCRFDWKRKLILGRELGAHVTPAKIWNSIRLWQFQCKFLGGERIAWPFCSKCGEMKQGMPTDIDAYAEELLERF
ncbi:MAG: radical SAM/SPASM domain-containing protein [Lachnospiraceae bacterium]